MEAAQLCHRGDEVVDGFRYAGAGFVRWSLAAGPDIGRVFDLSYILAELCDRTFPKHSVAGFLEKVLPILIKGLIELFGSHLPHLLHRILPFLTEFESCRALVQGGKKPADDALDLRFGKHPDAGLDNEVFMEEKDFGADAGLVRRWIIGSRKFFQCLPRGSFETGAEQPGELPPKR